MITGFDHFVILVNQLDTAQETFRHLGFDVCAGGEHPAFGSHNVLVALADRTYIELVAFKDPALAAQTFWLDGVKKLEAGEGFGAYVLGSNDLASDVAHIRTRAGGRLDVTDPSPGSRIRADGQRVAWHTTMVGGTIAGIFPFLIQDDTPHEWRITPPCEGLGSRARVKEIVLLVKDPNAARDAYHALLGAETKRVQNVAGDVQGYRITFDRGSIVLAHPERSGNAMADQLAQRGEGLYALTLQVEGIGRERREIKSRGITIREEGTGFLIAPEFACGARIKLV